MVDKDEDIGFMEFTYQFSSKHPLVSIQLSPYSTLPEVLEAFEGFLRTSGYHFAGQLDFVNDAIEPQEQNDSYN